MYTRYSLGRLIGAAITVAVVFVGYLVIEVADRLTASPGAASSEPCGFAPAFAGHPAL